MALETLEQALLSVAGIDKDGVQLTLDQALEYVHSAQTQDSADAPTFAQALKSPDRDRWLAACLDEIRSHTENGTWDWVELPQGATPVGSWWVLKIKRTEDGSVERFKARLVAQGFSQRPGWDFFENFAPTIRLSVVRAIFALVAADDMECDSLDITTAYLHANLEEEVYMKPPPGFEQLNPAGKKLYCLLRKWYLKLSDVMKQLGFIKVRSEPCVYVFDRQGDKVIVPTYVDDLHITARTTDAIQRVKEELGKHFKLRDLGPTKWFLGIHIIRDRSKHTLSLSQHQYCVDMLEEFGMADCRPVSTPMVPGTHLNASMSPQTPADVEEMKDKPYMRAVGKLNWLALATRPDISYTVSQLARFNSNPGPQHWQAVKRIFRYIQGTIDYKLTYGPSPHPTNFLTYSDADYAGDTDSSKSTSGYALLMGGAAVAWSSKLQTRIARSTQSQSMLLVSLPPGRLPSSGMSLRT